MRLKYCQIIKNSGLILSKILLIVSIIILFIKTIYQIWSVVVNFVWISSKDVLFVALIKFVAKRTKTRGLIVLLQIHPWILLHVCKWLRLVVISWRYVNSARLDLGSVLPRFDTPLFGAGPMPRSLRLPLRRKLVALAAIQVYNVRVDVIASRASCLSSVRRITKSWVSNNEIYLSFQPNNIMLIQILKPRLTIVVKLPHRLVVTEHSYTLHWLWVARLLLGAKKPSSSASDHALWGLSRWECLIVKKGQNSFLTQENLQYLLSLGFSQISVLDSLDALILSKLAHTAPASPGVLVSSQHSSYWLLVILNFRLGLLLLDFIFDIINTVT